MPYEFPLLINGEFRKTKEIFTVYSPFDNHLVGQSYRAGEIEIEEAIVAAVNAFQISKNMPVFERADKLAFIANDIRQNKEEFAQIICEEAGKPITTSRGEVDRAISTFTNAVEECRNMRGEQFPLDLESGSRGRWAVLKRFPIGPILGISPFNFPLNLVCHKVAPALATGNGMILKPASQTPFSSLRLAQSVVKAEWPAGNFNVLPMDSKNAHILLEDDRLPMVTFTGSPTVGWAIKNKSGRKRVTLELGGNAGVIIDKDADIEYAASRCVTGGFVQSGQNCISVQRIFVHETIYDSFIKVFIKKVRNLKVGDPADEKVFIGPMIHPDEVKRVKTWIDDAVKSGAVIEIGGENHNNLMMPTVLTNVDPDQDVSCQEVFAPVVVVNKFSDIDDAIKKVNDSVYGLQAGIFTNDARIIFKAYEELDVGGVVIGDVPTYRVDHMPYGGTKLSGMGREGVRFAIEEMTELKLMVMNI